MFVVKLCNVKLVELVAYVERECCVKINTSYVIILFRAVVNLYVSSGGVQNPSGVQNPRWSSAPPRIL